MWLGRWWWGDSVKIIIRHQWQFHVNLYESPHFASIIFFISNSLLQDRNSSLIEGEVSQNTHSFSICPSLTWQQCCFQWWNSSPLSTIESWMHTMIQQNPPRAKGLCQKCFVNTCLFLHILSASNFTCCKLNIRQQIQLFLQENFKNLIEVSEGYNLAKNVRSWWEKCQ